MPSSIALSPAQPSSGPVAAPLAKKDRPPPCWECLRRRWVCDSSRPVCHRCRDAGIVCPGYGDQKPLTWLAPGKVSARPRRPRTDNKAPPPKSAPAIRLKSESKSPTPMRASFPSAGHRGNGRIVPIMAPADADVDEVECNTLAVVVRREHHDNVARRRCQAGGGVPRFLRDDLSDIAEAAVYYNAQVYPSLLANQLAPSPFIGPICGIDLAPPSMRHALISMALGHRILQLPPEHRIDGRPAGMLPATGAISDPLPGPITGPAGKLWWRLHNHLGTAIQMLNDELAREGSQTTALTIVSVFVLLAADLFQSSSPQWRSHSIGFSTLVRLRGGMDRLINDPEEGDMLRPSMLTFVIMSVMANTTSPSYDQPTASSHMETMDSIANLYYTAMYPHLPCPSELFLEIIRVNGLRQELSVSLLDPTTGGATSAIRERLRSILSFSPDCWADFQSETAPLSTWLLIARAFHSATILFADSALNNPLPLSACVEDDATPSPPGSPAKAGDSIRSHHRARLFDLVEKGFAADNTKYCVVWPAIVAGFEAAKGTEAERDMVRAGLTDLCREAGATTMLAREVLSRFWKSGRSTWDECFDKGYAFII
ncbi:hypothetical protein DCS_02287 [Drechmeria coniospora]|uniref:Zn(2)-C6 fungal-type domain-containing protein n=1 Tax=Drechmeria coniospora TaxID=98403 RepID=A0A151GVL9_DRECN|nr:hypothetical protein DCS_02287 [Drechmeria coniospora]KYK61146.1 hypothetical protein DCS_02287 [Drechmeria coniospora]